MRRKVHSLAACLAVLAGCYLQPGVDARHSGHVPFDPALSDGRVADLEVGWGRTWGSIAGIAVSDGGVHVVHDRSLTTLNAATGATLWTRELFPPGDPSHVELGEPTVHRGRVHVPATIGTTGETRAFDSHTGTPMGSIAARGARVTAADHFVAGSYEEAVEGDVAARTTVTDLDDPAGSWTVDFRPIGPPIPGPVLVPTAPTIADEHLVVAVGGTVKRYPLDAPGCTEFLGRWNCAPQWSSTVDTSSPLTPVISDGYPDTVYAAYSSGRVYGLNPATGTTMWIGDVGQPITADPADGGDQTWLHLPAADGSDWIVDTTPCETAGPVFPPIPSCTFAAGRYTEPLGAPIAHQPTIVDGLDGPILFVTAGSRIAAYPDSRCDPTPCGPDWSDDVGAEIVTSPIVAWGRVYVGTADGRVVTWALPADS